MDAAGAVGLKVSISLRLPASTASGTPKPFAREDPRISSGPLQAVPGGCPPPHAHRAPWSQGRRPEDAERLGVVDDEPAVVGVREPEVAVEGRGAPVAEETVGDHHRATNPNDGWVSLAPGSSASCVGKVVTATPLGRHPLYPPTGMG